MTLSIGTGITIGGGISIASEAGGGGGFVSGNMTVGQSGGAFPEYGWKQGNYGSVTFPAFPTGPTVQIFYSSAAMGNTRIDFFDGTYGATVVNGTLGTIDGETSVTVTIDGVTETGTLVAQGGVGCLLEFVGDAFSLQSKNGQTLAVNMVAAPAPAADVSGTKTVGFNNMFGDRYGYQSGFPGPYGSVSVVPDAIATLYNTTTFTAVTFNGTTIGTTPTDSMTGLASGITSLSVTVDGITQTISTSGPSPGGYSVAGDPFSLATKNGQTLSLAIDLL